MIDLFMQHFMLIAGVTLATVSDAAVERVPPTVEPPVSSALPGTISIFVSDAKADHGPALDRFLSDLLRQLRVQFGINAELRRDATRSFERPSVIDRISESVQREIATAQVFIVIVTDDYINSRLALTELDAIEARLRQLEGPGTVGVLLPVVWRGWPTRRLPSILAERQALDPKRYGIVDERGFVGVIERNDSDVLQRVVASLAEVIAHAVGRPSGPESDPDPAVETRQSPPNEFVESVSIEAPTAHRTDDVPTLTLDTGKTQAAVVGSDIVSFAAGVTVERREAIINSLLLAQLVATNRVPDVTRIYDWYDAYFDVLTNVGWVVQDRGFSEYKEAGRNFETRNAILAIAASVLGPASPALGILTSSLNALLSTDDSHPWITIFDRETRNARAARFQISVAEQDADGELFVHLFAFGLEASSKVTQVLFFRVRKEQAKFRHCSGRLTINSSVLEGVSDAIKAKLGDRVDNYVSQLPDNPMAN